MMPSSKWKLHLGEAQTFACCEAYMVLAETIPQGVSHLCRQKLAQTRAYT